MTHTALFLAASSVATTVGWSPKVAIVMIICNILAFAIGKYTIQKPSAPPASGVFAGMGLPALIGSACLGHILGAGAILGLANSGVL
ncbi:MAG: photosystem I reaction center subunit PsaK [Cyanobacteriota bacterium]|nr:photosystem I reaction center subunit PsaK [Cyanobacteriota bacterium]